MKRVVKKSDVAHLWANKVQDDARNAQGNFYFRGDTIYSYGSHFPIAKHVVNEKGEKAVLFTERSYSNTTAKHINATRYAANHLNLIYCANPENSKEFNFELWKKQIENISSNLPTSRKPEIYLNQIESVGKQVKKYADFWGVKIPETLQVALSITSKEKYKEYAEKKAIAEKKAEVARKKKLKREHKESLKKWREGKTDRIYVHDGFDYLRLNKTNNRVETSQEVEIPVEIAKRFHAVLKRMLKKGGCINCENINVMHYSVQEINTDYIKAGCHTISIAEINDISAALNLEPVFVKV